MKRLVLPVLLFSFVLVGFRFHKRIFPPPPTPQHPIINSLSYYHGTSYVSIIENVYDVSLLNKELSSPQYITLTPDNKYLLISQNTGEVFAFTKMNRQNFSSQPNLVTTLPVNSAPLIKFSSSYPQDHQIYFEADNTLWKSKTYESNYRLYAPNPTTTTSKDINYYSFPQNDYSINSSTNEVLFLNNPIVHRHKDAIGKIGHLTNITFDPSTNHFFFVDAPEGRLYEGSLK